MLITNLDRIKKVADRLGMWYFIKNYNDIELYDFLCYFFLGDTTFNVCEYTVEEFIDVMDKSLGQYKELLIMSDKIEIYSIAKEIKEKN